MATKHLILVVDDEESARRMLTLFLEKEYEVLTAGSAKEGTEMLDQYEPAVVLTDIKMPGEDGLSLLRKIKKRVPDVPVVIMTGHGDKKLAINAVKDGAFDFLEKPFKKEEILISIKRAVNRRILLYRKQLVLLGLKKRNSELEDMRLQLREAVEIQGSIAHEVSNPAAAIKTSAEMIGEYVNANPIKKDDISRVAKRIEKMSESLITVVRSVLRLVRKGEPPILTSCDLCEIAENSVFHCEEMFREKNVNLEVKKESPSIFFEGSSDQILQLIINLVKNSIEAVKDLEEKWVKLVVRESAREIEIIVTDSGDGIPEKIRSQILKPLFTTKKANGGTGLGLSICKRVVDTHQGDIQVDASSPNTRFVVRIPKKQKEAKKAA